MNLIDWRRNDFLSAARRPFNLDLIYTSDFTKSEVQAPLVLRAESASAGYFLHLLLTFPDQPELCVNSATIAFAPLQLKFDPLVGGRHFVLIKQERTSLVGDNSIEC